MKKIMLIVGIKYSGKSVLLKEIIKKIPFIKGVNFGEEMLTVSKNKNLSRETLKQLSVKEQKELGKKVATNIAKRSEKLILLDTHVFVKVNDCYLPCLSKNILSIINPILIVWVECSPSVIRERMLNTQGNIDEKELQFQQDLTKSYLLNYCFEYDSIFCRINNDFSLTDSVNCLEKLMHQVLL